MAKKATRTGRKKPAPPPLRLEWLDPDSLSDNPANWRTHPQQQTDALRDVISEAGWAGALLYNERTKRLIDGHARKALFAGKGSPVPVLVGSWSEEQERLILATLDPLGAMAGADAGLYAKLLAGMNAAPGLQEALEGIAAGAGLAELLTPPQTLPQPGGGGDDFDATPQGPGPTRTNVGEVWVIGGRHRLLVGDCTVKGNVERLMGGEKAFIMVTDQPYGVEFDAEWRKVANVVGDLGEFETFRQTGLVTNDDRADWTEAWKLFDGDVAYVWHASLHISVVQQSLVDCDLWPRSQVIWAKPHFLISRGHYHWQHEPCWYAVRKGKTSRWSGDRSQSTLWQIAGLNPMGRSRDAGDAPTGHGTQKPIECMSRPIRNHGDEGDIVYDPFLGSGTTLIAAHRLNRVCYGCELEPRYADVILKRAEAEGLPVEKSRG